MLRSFRGQRYTVVSRLVRKMSTTTSDKDVCRIGCASGFWGDTAVAPPQLIHTGNIDFLVFDYLSEITMSLLAASKMKNPAMGFTPDFVDVGIGPYLKAIQEKGIRVVTNAGGINPKGCAEALHKAADKAGVSLDIAVVSGDDMMPMKDKLTGMPDMHSGDQLPNNVLSINAYLGAQPISHALDMGASIVITGRCVDSALVLGPLIHKFKWNMSDYNRLAGGSLAGHLIECGAQATGGLFTDHHKVPDWWNIGFPIAECYSNGDCIITKPERTGGMVSRGTVCEQLVYEIGDPAAYLLPDVTCDFTHVHVKELEDDRVLVSGAKGKAPSSSYKVSATYPTGYRITAVAIVMGGKAVEKGQRTGEEILKRVRTILKKLKMQDFKRVHLKVIGSGDSYGKNTKQLNDVPEAVLWLAAEHTEKRALEILAREIAPAGTGMAPGLCGIAGGRPKVSPVIRLHSFLTEKEALEVSVAVNGKSSVFAPSPPEPTLSITSDEAHISEPEMKESSSGPLISCPLSELCWARSGDKGDTCNIGVVARDARYWPLLRERLTADAVGEYFSHVFPDGKYTGFVDRYELQGIQGLNFVLRNSLGGGGIASLRPDPQGKAYAQILLDMMLEKVPADLLSKS